MSEKKTYKPDLGYGYKGSYQDKVTGDKQGYLRIYLNVDQLKELEVNDNGYMQLAIFPTSSKKSDKSPDVHIRASTKSTESKQASRAAAERRAVKQPKSGNAFPF